MQAPIYFFKMIYLEPGVARDATGGGRITYQAYRHNTPPPLEMHRYGTDKSRYHNVKGRSLYNPRCPRIVDLYSWFNPKCIRVPYHSKHKRKRAFSNAQHRATANAHQSKIAWGFARSATVHKRGKKKFRGPIIFNIYI